MASNSSKLVTKLNYTNTTKALIKQSIRNKGVEVSDSDTLRSYATKINEISTSIDQSDATVTASDMVQGKVAYNDNNRVVGILPMYSSLLSEATNIQADDTNSLIKSNFTSDNRLVLNSSSNVQINLPYSTLASTIGLRADILKQDEVVLGITGTYSTGVADIRYLYSVGNISITEITPQLMQSISNGDITVAEIATYPAIAINSYYDNYIVISLANHDTQHCSYLFKIENDSLVYIDKLHNNDTNWSTGYCWQSIITDIDTENDIVYVLTARTDYTYSENTILSVFENTGTIYTRVDNIVTLPSQGNINFGNMIFRPYGYTICGRYLYKFNYNTNDFDYIIGSSYINLLSNWDNLTGEVTAQGTTFYQYSFYGIGSDGYDYAWIQNSVVDNNYTVGAYINGVISPDKNKCIFPNGVILEVVDNEITLNRLAEFDMQTLVGFIPKYIYYISDNYYVVAPQTGDACLVEFDDINNIFTLLYSNISNDISNYYAKGMMYNNSTIFNLDASAVLAGYEKLTIYAPIQDTTHQVGVIIEGNPVYYNSFNKQLQSADMLFGKTAFDFNGEVLTGIMPNNGQLSYIPTTSQQIIPLGYTSGGIIAGVTSAIDSDIQQDNIKVGVDILGVTGTFTSDATATSNDIIDGKTAYINGQKITGGLSNINALNAFTGVNATVVNNNTNINFHQIDEVDFYWKYDVNNPNKTLTIGNNILATAIGLTADKIKQGETILNVTGSVIELSGETINVTPTTSQQVITPDSSSGKNGITEVTISAVDNTIDNNILSGNIKNGVSILGVTGSVVELVGEQTTIPATTSQQIVVPTIGNGFTQVTIPAVTSAIDANILPENIKMGVTILGVTGNYQ